MVSLVLHFVGHNESWSQFELKGRENRCHFLMGRVAKSPCKGACQDGKNCCGHLCKYIIRVSCFCFSHSLWCVLGGLFRSRTVKNIMSLIDRVLDKFTGILFPENVVEISHGWQNPEVLLALPSLVLFQLAMLISSALFILSGVQWCSHFAISLPSHLGNNP